MAKRIENRDLFLQRIFWKNQLRLPLPVTRFPGQSVLQSSGPSGCDIQFSFSAEDSARIVSAARKKGLATYIFLLTAVHVLLYRYTGDEDLLVGAPVWSQHASAADPMRFLPLRTPVSGKLTFSETLARTRTTVVAAYSNQDCNLDEVVTDSSPGARGVEGLFGVAATLTNIHGELNPHQLLDHVVFRFSVTDDNGIVGRVLFRQQKYETWIRPAIRHLLNIVSAACSGVGREIRSLEMLSLDETETLLRSFCGSTRSYPVTVVLDQIFDEQALLTPNKTAVCSGKEIITYRNLKTEADQLASALRDVGVGAGQFVGILLGRGIPFVISILGVLKAGAAYVPLDTTYPFERIRQMVTDSGMQVMLGDEGSLADEGIVAFLRRISIRFAVFDRQSGRFGRVLNLADDSVTAAVQVQSSNAKRNRTAEDPAYMIYTSGSTGMPKGAIIRHDGAVNHIFAQFEALQLSSETKFLQTAPVSSDISVWQFLAPLLISGEVVIASNDVVGDGEGLLWSLRKHGITIVEVVPGVLKLLVEAASKLPLTQRELPDLRWLMVTGEVVSTRLVNSWLVLYPAISVVNCYGPSEASDDVTQAIIPEPLPDCCTTVHIGKPLANIQILILDRDQQLVPTGVPGEICVSGIAVGSGYWNDAERTRRSFVENQFPIRKGPVMYKTGDMGKWLADGNIEFLGRKDHQIKIRGFRVEKGEIEHALIEHPKLTDSVVVLDEERDCLIAYCIPVSNGLVSASELRSYLGYRLPEHMIPSTFVVTDSFPLLPSGKINLTALARIPREGPDDSSKHRLASGPTDEILARLWSNVLGKSVDRTDNFFELGGHSLLATVLIGKIRETFKIEISVRSLFEHPTVSGLARCVEAERGRNGKVPPLLRPIERTASLPLSAPQQRLWFLDKMHPDSSMYNVPSAVRIRGNLDVSALRKALDGIVLRHEILRTSFPTHEGKPIQVIREVATVHLDEIDVPTASEQREAEAIRIAAEAVDGPFDLSTGPLLRALLIKLDDNDRVLVITTHHIVSDGWSMAVLIREMIALYEAFTTGKRSPLEPLPIQYADFALWQNDWLTGEVMASQLSYWKKQLASPLPELKLPTDYPRTKSRSCRGDTEILGLPGELVQAVERLSCKTGVTAFMTLLAAFQILLHRYTGQTDIVLGADIANRNRPETENLIGFFVNMLVLRIDVSGDPSVSELLVRVRHICLDGYANQDVPFDRIVEELQPERVPNRNPLFQAVIVLQNLPTEALSVSGLQLTPIAVPHRTSKFDLILTIEQTGAEMSASIEYSTDLFKAETVSRLLKHYRNVLRSITNTPEQRLSEVHVLSDEECAGLDTSDFPDLSLTRKELETIIIQTQQTTGHVTSG